MNSSQTILKKSLVNPYYRQNIGFFLFIFIVFFGVIAPSQIPAYHYGLITGMLKTPALFSVVFLAWLIYMIKCNRFVIDCLHSPDYSFLNMLSRMDGKKSYFLLLRMQLLLSLPVSLYGFAVTGIAFQNGWYGEAVLVLLYILFLCLAGAGWHQYLLRNPGKENRIAFLGNHPLAKPMFLLRSHGKQFYWQFLARYLIHDSKLLVAGTKFFSCGMLYLLVKSLTQQNYDTRMSFLLFSFGIFSHSLLIFRCRNMEESSLLFYRGLPLSPVRRAVQYGLFYLILLIPEGITIGWLTPGCLHYSDAIQFLVCGYSILLLLNSLLFLAPFSMKNYLKLAFCIFVLEYFFTLSGELIPSSIFFFAIAGGLFISRYYRYQHKI
jgi:hypothetical protein